MSLQFILRLGVGLLASAPAFSGLVYAQAPGDPVPGMYIVELQAGAQSGLIAGQHGVAVSRVYRNAVNGFSGFVPPGRMQALLRDPRVVSVTQDRYVTAFGRGVAETASSGAGQRLTIQSTTSNGDTIPTGVDRIGGHSVSFTGNGVGVAIVDTGLDFDHQDLQPLGDEAFDFFGGSGQDDNGHGTHVGGIVAARDNGIDVVGVAQESILYAVKVLDAQGRGSDDSVIAGLDWVAANWDQVNPPIRVVNMSLGRPGTLDDNPTLHDAIKTLTDTHNISVVVAAGNDPGVEVKDHVPATYPAVMAIASTTATDGQANKWGQQIVADTASYFTTDGAYEETDVDGDGTTDGLIGVTISAPGEAKEDVNNGGLIQSAGILSTALGGGTTRMSGTSMSSPHVAGVVALMWDKTLPNILDPETARSAIRNSADQTEVAPEDSPTSSYTFDGEREGILFAPNAVEWISSTVTDIAISGINAPASVLAGEVASVDVTVENVGTEDVTTDFTITLTYDTDAVAIGMQTISGGLAAGTSTTLTFSWNTSGALTGDHTLTAAHDLSDDDASNDTLSTVVTVEDAVTDITITTVSAPASVVQGESVNVDVTVENLGNQDVTTDVTVTLTDDTDAVTIGMQTIPGGLAAGTSTTLTFSWNTSDASIGDHTLTAAHDLSDDDATNDSASTVVNVSDVSTMHVGDLDALKELKGKSSNWEVFVTVTIHDSDHNPVEAAEVTVTFSGASSGTTSDTTGSDGTVTFTTGSMKGGSQVTVTVDHVAHSTLSYEATDNHDPDGDSNGTTITINK